jgi:hypothetical protein
MAGSPANRTDYKVKDQVPKLFGADTYEYGFVQISTLGKDGKWISTFLQKRTLICSYP